MDSSAKPPAPDERIVDQKYAVGFVRYYSQLKQEGRVRPWMEQSLAEHKSNIRMLSKYCSDIGAKLIFADLASISATMSDLYSELVTDENVHYISVPGELEKLNPKRRPIRWRYDGHWNLYGNSLVGKIVAKAIKDALEPSLTRAR